MGYDPEIVGSRMNPDLTPEMEREVAFFKKWGYLVVEEAITPDQIEDLRAALDRKGCQIGRRVINRLFAEQTPIMGHR